MYAHSRESPPTGNLQALLQPHLLPSSYKTVKGRSHSMDERSSTHSYKSHATSQPTLPHTLSLTVQPTTATATATATPSDTTTVTPARGQAMPLPVTRNLSRVWRSWGAHSVFGPTRHLPGRRSNGPDAWRQSARVSVRIPAVTRLPLCAGALWPMPAWVWHHIRSVVFVLRVHGPVPA